MVKKQDQEINTLRALFPQEISVKVERSKDGGFVAVINTFPGCITQADSFSELIEMVNDAVRTYFEIPEQYTSYMPTYLPPVKVAQELDVFPMLRGETEVKFKLPPIREAANC